MKMEAEGGPEGLKDGFGSQVNATKLFLTCGGR